MSDPAKVAILRDNLLDVSRILVNLDPTMLRNINSIIFNATKMLNEISVFLVEYPLEFLQKEAKSGVAVNKSEQVGTTDENGVSSITVEKLQMVLLKIPLFDQFLNWIDSKKLHALLQKIPTLLEVIATANQEALDKINLLLHDAIATMNTAKKLIVTSICRKLAEEGKLRLPRTAVRHSSANTGYECRDGICGYRCSNPWCHGFGNTLHPQMGVQEVWGSAAHGKHAHSRAMTEFLVKASPKDLATLIESTPNIDEVITSLDGEAITILINKLPNLRNVMEKLRPQTKMHIVSKLCDKVGNAMEWAGARRNDGSGMWNEYGSVREGIDEIQDLEAEMIMIRVPSFVRYVIENPRNLPGLLANMNARTLLYNAAHVTEFGVTLLNMNRNILEVVLDKLPNTLKYLKDMGTDVVQNDNLNPPIPMSAYVCMIPTQGLVISKDVCNDADQAYQSKYTVPYNGDFATIYSLTCVMGEIVTSDNESL
ncbi:hypothetical protein EGR_10790 [Echinococcus granulosus]|uniref:Uncharacterized protein n=1 Tax=Echinococcus granulosus TaxID=6210 RepID=W6U7K9_ECHGR|nr:hypothetical protein EGR_10790 [Echinococcus granulosus]EUB54352.1 hypothetical protein EGR_10790 [Echinococcus granulosus]